MDGLLSLQSAVSLTCTWNGAQSPVCHFNSRTLAAGTYRPGSGCCTSCTRSRRPLCVRTPLRPRPPSPGELASRPRIRRTAPAGHTGTGDRDRERDRDTHTKDESQMHQQQHTVRSGGGGASWNQGVGWEALTTMSSSVTRGCRLFTVILVPSKGLTTGWKDSIE